MPLLSAPLLPGHKGKAVADLHNIILWFINNGHLNVSEGEDLQLLSRLSQEQMAELYGDATAHFVGKIYQVVGGWEGDAKQISESAAIEIEKFFLLHSDTASHKVYGRIVNENGVGIPDASITVFLKSLRTEEVVGNGQADTKGYYEIEVGALPDLTNNIKRALQLQATFNTTSVESPLIFNVGKTTNVDLVLPVANEEGMETEFQVIEAKVREAVGESELSTLTHEDLDFLRSINENEILLLTYLYAVEYARETNGTIPAETFYGLLRTNGIASYQAILNWPADQIVSLLSDAVAGNYIFTTPEDILALSEKIKEVAVLRITNSIEQPAAEASTIRILKTALSEDRIKQFLEYYYSGDTLDEAFWSDENLGEVLGNSPQKARDLKKALGHAVNTGSNPSLVRYIMDRGIVETVSQSEEQWEGLLHTLVNQEDFVIPTLVEGANTEERLKNYARSLYEIYSNSYKTEYARAKIAVDASNAFPMLKESLESFVADNPEFDVLRTPVAKFADGTYNAESYGGEEFIQEVGKVQRLNALTNNFDAVEKLAAEGVTSAMDITRMTQAEFQQSFADKLGGSVKALAVYDVALSVKTISQLITLEPYQVYQVHLPVIHDSTSSGSTPSDAQLEWRSLFGSVDYCTCEQCLSVFSPAAYFVDCMELLRRFDANTTVSAYDWLKEKRSDLWDLKLTCKNTNTSIPAIDIVNETLETIVGVGTSKPTLSNPAVAKDTLSDARLNRAIPEHINSAGPVTPYHKLLKATYPWTAPYNYYADQCKSYLKVIDLKPYQIAQAFSSEDYPKSLSNSSLAGCYLDMVSSYDLQALKDSTTAQIPKYYGLKEYDNGAKTTIINPADRTKTISVPTGNLQTGFLEKVNIFLQQAQISFEDLQELLDCHYVNPAVWINGVLFRKLRIKGIPETTCDTDKLIIAVEPAGGEFTDYDFQKHFLFNAMRIVRLSRKTGLSKYDVDRILTAYGFKYNTAIQYGTIENLVKFIAQVLRAKELLKAPLEELLPFWGDFPHMPYHNYSGDQPQQLPTFYERLFRNQSVVPDFEKTPTYPFKELSLYDQWITSPVTVPYEQMKSWVLAILKLTNKELEYLIKNLYGDIKLFPNPTDFITSNDEFVFTHANILNLYREVTLARLLKISVEEWVAYRRWIFRHGTDREPFSNTAPADAGRLLRFIEKIKVFEQQALPFDVMRYAFWDGVDDPQEKELRRNLLLGQLNGLKDILSKIHFDYQDTDNNNTYISGKKLYDLLLSLVDPQDADFLVNGIALKEDLSLDTFTEKELHRFDILLSITRSVAGPEKDVLFGNSSTAPETNKQLRLEALVNIFLPTLKQNANRKELVSYLSAQNSISTEFTDLLLSGTIRVDGESGLEILMSELFVTSAQPVDLSLAVFQKPFKVIEKLHKVALVINSLALSIDEFIAFKQYYELLQNSTAVTFLSNPVSGNLLATTVSNWPDDLSATYNFIEWMQVRNAFIPSPLGLRYVLAKLSNRIVGADTEKEVWVEAMSKALQIDESELEVLVGDKNKSGDPNAPLPVGGISDVDTGSLNFNFFAGLPQPFQYRKLFAALDMMNWLEAGASVSSKIATALSMPTTQAHADKIIEVVRARYGATEWLDVVQPVSDVLRVNRRDAMVAFLLAYPPDDYAGRWVSELDLFETLLMDTQVMPVVQTSRIRQAISSIQLFFDRCILQREVTLSGTVVTLSGEAIRQWNMWRKWYRVWEANRKVFVYPENWIEPDLRDDKSPFFKELEKFVNQNDITPETMEDAYKAYLERLNEVAFLDIIGYYVEEVKTLEGDLLDSIVHTFGRTRSYPHLYYYRKRVNRVWNAWTKMEAQIDGDHFVPVMWRGRLRLYWVTFLEKIIPEPKKVRLDEEQKPPRLRHEILLHWTEYKNGQWSPSQLGSQNAVLNFGGAAAGPSTAEELKYHIARPLYSDPKDWAHHGLAHTQKSYEREVARMKERMLVYATKGAEGEIFIECATYMEGLTYSQYRTFLFDKYSKNVANSISEDAWFGNRYKVPVDYGHLWKDDIHVIDFDIVDAVEWNTAWFSKRLDDYYDFENTIRLTPIGSYPCFVIKHNKVELLEWHNYTQYNGYVDPNGRLLYSQKNNIYVYPLKKHESDGYDQIVEDFSVSNNTIKLLNKAPDFNDAPIKEKYFILQKQHPDSYRPVQISKFFYQDYKNLFFVEKYTGADFAATPYALPPKATGSEGTSIDKYAIENNRVTQDGVAEVQTYYRFYSFYHYRVDALSEKLNTSGIKGLFDWNFTRIGQEDRLDFQTTYAPTGAVLRKYEARSLYPDDKIDFWLDAPTAIYNWELFFHIPMFIANKLMQEQRFMEAMDWYHLVFNPTNQEDSQLGRTGSARFWQFHPFFEHSKADIPSIQDIMAHPNLPIAVQQWAKDPFKPHLVARTRIGAYMRNVVMKYLDNLVAWGDNLFRRDTMESINEATLLYVLAAQILGRRPVKIPARLSTPPMDYQDLLDTGRMNAFSNALVPVQTYLAATTKPAAVARKLQMTYFCIPPNEKLLSYWDVVADRLHKIRNSQNIDGVERQLALFEPPIDPAMLVRAAAAGVSIADAVAELYAPLPAYRFPTMVQKATELAQEVKSLGSALLAAIEKRDAEQLALLRSVQEQKVLEAAKEARTLQIQEAQAQVAGLNEQKELINDRIGHYQKLVDKGLNREEQLQLDSLQQSIPLKEAQGDLSVLSSVFYAIPSINIQVPFSVGPSFGGPNIGSIINAEAASIGITATVNDIKGSMAGIKASYARRREDWDVQLKLANREIKQIEKQIIAAEIRQAIAEKELRVHEIQIQNARDMDAAMHDKYSNEDLYNWMISEISYTYFQSYKLAFDIARKAERCYRYELGVEPVKDFIQFGYWNSLKKGLLAADNLLFDVKRLEMAYLEQNVRYHELSKSISLAAVDPVALLNLRADSANSGTNISLPEWIFDMDYPGHYFRRIKSVSISIPCVAGPYTTVAAKLTLISSKYRKNALPGSTYAEVDSDSRFNYLFNGGQSIATSTAQNDSGLFELNFRDERYLPFEGCGAISNWKLDLPSAFANYDRNTITDVIIHINYTARYDGGLATKAKAYLNGLMSDANTGNDPKGIPPYHLLSLKHEFSTDWYAAFQTTVPVPDSSPTNDKGRPLAVTLRKSHFPIGVQKNDLEITRLSIISRKNEHVGYDFTIDNATSKIKVPLPYTGSGTTPIFSAFTGMIKDDQTQTINVILYRTDGTALTESDLDDLYLLVEYRIELP